jgi:hypothetical protein
MTKGTCSVCNEEYRCSAYYYEMKRSEFPDKCYKCRVQERSDLRGELEGGWIDTKEKQKIKNMLTESKKFSNNQKNGKNFKKNH